jgi:hypothetical protein
MLDDMEEVLESSRTKQRVMNRLLVGLASQVRTPSMPWTLP